ncbi:Glycine-rich domain-containing protein-like - like 3 [Theobroma cacao]|nr:Glycine-rich domain-containing protein-like - like 3 [Theobroma cacao]
MYKYCWLPRLAIHAESSVSEGPLVVPLDCEWIWHCHRLNPGCYKADCKELYGRILDNQNVISSTRAICRKQTEEIWKRMYPDEPYVLNTITHFLENVEDFQRVPKSTEYDLISAVKRQSLFFYQVSRFHMNGDLFLEEAVARYKGFLHLFKRNWEKSVRCFCVPTYDIDLIWHCHQLHPFSYCKYLVATMGKILEHDDTDSDRAKGKKLDNGFSETTKQWEDTFGSRSNIMLEIVGVRDLPHGHKGSLFVTISKKQPDIIFNCKRSLSILSETREKQVTVFQCEPRGDLVFELMTPSALAITRAAKKLGTTSISLKDLVNPVSQLSMEKWFDLVSNSVLAYSKPTSLRIAFSFTPPIPATYVLHSVQTQTRSISNICFPLIHGMDEAGNDVISIQIRDSVKEEASDNCQSKKEVIGVTTSGERHVLAEASGTGWSLMNSNWRFRVQEKFNEDGHAFGFKGNRKVIVFRGRKLGYEINSGKKQKKEQHFMTAVEFSVEDPYGKAVALLNFKSGIMEVYQYLG